MKKIEQFQITSLMLSGFKSYEEPTELVFGNPTVITGGNGRGKSSIADAIAFAVTGCPFFGERGIDRLHNENNPDVAIRMCFVDETGTLHELNRTRRKNRMTITYDGYEIRQLDLADLFGERDVILCTLLRSWVRMEKSFWSDIFRRFLMKRYSLSYLSPCGNISKTRRFSRRRAVLSAAGRRSVVWRNALPI